MNVHRILVPTDFSDCSDAALSFACALAKEHAGSPSELLLAHVIEASVPGYDEELGVLEPEMLKTKLQTVAASREHGIPMETVVVHGDPRKEIVRIADERDVDLIVIGTHGRKGITHLLLGSTAEAVLRSCKCPVMTVHVKSSVTAESSALRRD